MNIGIQGSPSKLFVLKSRNKYNKDSLPVGKSASNRHDKAFAKIIRKLNKPIISFKQ